MVVAVVGALFEACTAGVWFGVALPPALAREGLAALLPPVEDLLLGGTDVVFIVGLVKVGGTSCEEGGCDEGALGVVPPFPPPLPLPCTGGRPPATATLFLGVAPTFCGSALPGMKVLVFTLRGLALLALPLFGNGGNDGVAEETFCCCC